MRGCSLQRLSEATSRSARAAGISLRLLLPALEDQEFGARSGCNGVRARPAGTRVRRRQRGPAVWDDACWLPPPSGLLQGNAMHCVFLKRKLARAAAL